MPPPDETVQRVFWLPTSLAGWVEKMARQWGLTEGQLLAELLLPVVLFHQRDETYDAVVKKPFALEGEELY